jgi:preprotein translocase subunit SecY
MNMLGGGALNQFSLFALGVSPYITASIIIQLLSMDVIPSLSQKAKSGEAGKKELAKTTK